MVTTGKLCCRLPRILVLVMMVFGFIVIMLRSIKSGKDIVACNSLFVLFCLFIKYSDEGVKTKKFRTAFVFECFFSSVENITIKV